MTKEGKINVDTMKRIRFKKKTTLFSLRNLDWRTVKYKTEKVNNRLIDTLTNKITELNDLIYEGAKLVSEKNRGSSEEYIQKVKNQMGTQIRIATKKS